jgi:uncharacterized protein YajQ (UPF0234 family)
MPSFDIVSELNMQEVDNAINQARKELIGRFDFRGSKSEIQWDKKAITLIAEDDFKMSAIKDILLKKLHHRGVDIQALKFEKAEPMGGMLWKQPINLIQGLEKETAKKVVKIIKDSQLKVQAAINDDLVRVSSKSIDSLQECMTLMRASKVGVPLQFSNMRS